MLPRLRQGWQFVDLLDSGAADEAVFAVSAVAAEKDLVAAAGNPVCVEAVRLLLLIPFAAQAEDFGEALRACDLAIGSTPDLFELSAAAGARLDEIACTAGLRSDFGKLAGRALIGTLNEQIGQALPGLFDGTPRDVQLEAQRLSRSSGIATLTRAFFGRLLSDLLSYWLDWTLAMQTDPGRRLPDDKASSAFDLALQQYAHEATRIIQEFAPGWYGKRLHEDGRIGSPQAAAFAAVAMKKITEELRRKRDADG